MILLPLTKLIGSFRRNISATIQFLTTIQKDTILVFNCCQCKELVMETSSEPQVLLGKPLRVHSGCGGLLVLHTVV
jgi:hypothetical protein